MATVAKLIQLGPYVSDGKLVTQAKLFHYIAGTLTDNPIYRDPNKVLTHPQPMPSDSNGLFTFFADGAYKFRITDASEVPISPDWDNWVITDPDVTGQGTAIVSANEMTIPADGNIFLVSGNNNISKLTATQSEFKLIFSGFLTMSASATLILPNNDDIVITSGDVMEFVDTGGGVYRLSNFEEDKKDKGVQGQCRLTKSGADLLLNGSEEGNRITLSNGSQWVTTKVPAGGITLADTALDDEGDALLANTHYYIYAYLNVSVLTLVASVTVPILDAPQHVYHKTGDGTRLLVGLARTDAGANWQDTLTNRGVLSWYNRKPILAQTTLSVDYTKTNTSYAEFEAAMHANFLCWANDMVRVRAHYNGRITAGTWVNVALAFNSDTVPEAETESFQNAEGSNGQLNSHTMEFQTNALAEATYHYANLLAKAQAGTTYIVSGGATVGAATLTVTIMG